MRLLSKGVQLTGEFCIDDDGDDEEEDCGLRCGGAGNKACAGGLNGGR